MQMLQELHLEGNSSSGNIDFPPSLVEYHLRILDHSCNHLVGYFPDSFGSLTELQVLNLAEINLSSSLPTSINGMDSLTLFENHFTGPLLDNFSNNLQSFNVSYNDLSGVISESLRKLLQSSFYLGNSGLQFSNGPPKPKNSSSRGSKTKHIKTFNEVVVIVACAVVFIILILLVIFIHYIRKSWKHPSDDVTEKNVKCVATNPSGITGRDILGSCPRLQQRSCVGADMEHPAGPLGQWIFFNSEVAKRRSCKAKKGFFQGG
ncbi:hypothetical protein Ancab_021470 [Ancistrocladus abbreviatus]